MKIFLYVVQIHPEKTSYVLIYRWSNSHSEKPLLTTSKNYVKSLTSKTVILKVNTIDNVNAKIQIVADHNI